MSIAIGESKHAKYNTGNFISKYLVNTFYSDISKIVDNLTFNSVIDIGCGEGHLLKSMEKKLLQKKCYAIDYDPNEIADAQKNLPFCDVKTGSVYELDFKDSSIDLVICTEVFEHLEYPEKAIEEVFRVCKTYVILSVPREPIWRAMNMARGAYLSDMGNTPGHLNHWSSKSFSDFVSQKFQIVEIRKPLPWTIICAKKR